MAVPESPHSPRVPPQDLPRWWVFHGTARHHPAFDLESVLPPPPPWRAFHGAPELEPPEEILSDATNERLLGTAPLDTTNRTITPEIYERLARINAAILLRRPLLVTGPTGVGKSVLAEQVARELNLGPVLRWPVNSRSTLRSGLYDYDPVAQIHDLNLETSAPGNSGHAATDAQSTGTRPAASGTRHSGRGAERIGDYLRLGPVGTAFLPYRLPRVLVIDEFDTSDYDLAGDLLDLFETGRYTVPELARLNARAPRIEVPTADPGQTAVVHDGAVECSAFPIIVITCNTERILPATFLRRCVPLRLTLPTREELEAIVAAHFSGHVPPRAVRTLTTFTEQCAAGRELSVDQLLNAVYLTTTVDPESARQHDDELRDLAELVWHELSDQT